jgi:hypothetical protein
VSCLEAASLIFLQDFAAFAAPALSFQQQIVNDHDTAHRVIHSFTGNLEIFNPLFFRFVV